MCDILIRIGLCSHYARKLKGLISKHLLGLYYHDRQTTKSRSTAVTDLRYKILKTARKKISLKQVAKWSGVAERMMDVSLTDHQCHHQSSSVMLLNSRRDF